MTKCKGLEAAALLLYRAELRNTASVDFKKNPAAREFSYLHPGF